MPSTALKTPLARKPDSEPRRRLEQVREIFNARVNVTTQLERDKRISLAEGGCLLPPHISVQTAMQEVMDRHTGNPFQIYPFNPVDMDFVNDIYDYFKNRCDIPLDDDTGLVFGFGSSHIFDAVLSVICEPGDVVLMPVPYYHLYADWPTKWGATADFISTRREDGYKMTGAGLRAWLEAPENKSKSVKCLQITNPLITGAVYSYEELEDIAAVVREYGLHVFCDEVFRDSEYGDTKTVSLASLPGMTDYVVTANSGSKTRGSADLRLGWACGPKHIIDGAIRYMERTVTEIPMYLQHIGSAILRTPQSYLDEARREYETRANLVIDLVAQTNARLNVHFGTRDVAFITVPVKPESGHYMAINFDTLTDFIRPDGKILDDCAAMTAFFYDPSGDDDPAKGVVFSSGYSRGHDDMTMYVAFAQLGYEDVNNALAPFHGFELFKSAIIRSSNRTDISEDELTAMARIMGMDFAGAHEPDLTQAYTAGHDILRECFGRMERAIKQLMPSAAFNAAYRPRPFSKQIVYG